MKKAILVLLLMATAQMGCAQLGENVLHVSQFKGMDVGTKLTNAQNACSTNVTIPCILYLDPILAVYPTGTLPAKCSNCYWQDWRTGPPSGGSGLPTLPTAPNGVAQIVCSTPSGGVGQAAAWCRPGVATTNQSGAASYTLAATDVGRLVEVGNAAGATVTIPDAGSTGFDQNYATTVCNTNTGTVTVQRQTSSLINYVSGGSEATGAINFSLAPAQCASIYTDPQTSTNWFARVLGGATFTTLAYWPSQTGYNNAALTAAANFYIVRGITIPVQLQVGHIAFSVTVADGTNNTDVCLYSKAGNLIANVGGATYAAAADQTKPIAQGSVTIAPGSYYLALLSAGSTVAIRAAGNIPTFASSSVSGGIAGTCGASIIPPADSFVSQGTIPDVEFLP